jgi:hypothetical protein
MFVITIQADFLTDLGICFYELFPTTRESISR